MIVRADLPRNTGADGDGVAQNEADHFEKCPVCSRWFDIRDLAQLHRNNDRGVIGDTSLICPLWLAK